MERSLVAGAILLLFLEIGLLLTGLDEVPSFRFPGTGSGIGHGQYIAKMKRTESNVRRRERSSLVWEESQAQDQLYEFDSVLTLAGSTAQIQFKSNTVLNIDENTLVVIEENQDRKDGSLRIRFSRGMIRSKNPSRLLEIASETWTLTASQGSVVNLVSLHDGRFDLELSEGHAKLDSKNASEEINRGERLLIRDSQIEERKRLDEELVWEKNLSTRVYARSFPVETELKWKGSADTLRMIKPDKAEEKIALTPDSDSDSTNAHKLTLNEGTYLVSLEKGGRVSQTLTLQIRQAPLFRYYSPLPRNRIRTGAEPTFSWEKSDFAARYRLELSPSRNFSSDVRSWTLDRPRFTTNLENEGAFYWRVITLDENQTPIPEPRIYPLYIVPDPFQSPRLNAPTIRSPASPPEGSQNKRRVPGAGLFMKWRQLLVPVANAAEESEREGVSDFEAVFSWSPVEGADHYVIEISKSPGFEDPIVNQRVSSPQFIWQGFLRGVYFWRVAAGLTSEKGGRLGLFSSIAMANLEDLESFAGPGVTLARKEDSPPAPIEPSPAPPAKKKPKERRPTPKAQANKANTDMPPPAPTEPQQAAGTWHKRLTWHPAYRLLEMDGTRGIRGSFTGPAPLAFELEVQYISPKGRFWELLLTYDETDWKPKDAAATPFQANLKEQHLSVDLFSGRKSSSWSYGLGAEILPAFKRKAPEEGELQNLTIAGPSVRYLKNMGERSNLDLLLSARFGEVFGLRARADWRFTLARTERALYTLAPSLSYGYFQSEETKLRDLRPGLSIGIAW